MNTYLEKTICIYITSICVSIILIYGFIRCKYLNNDFNQTKIIYYLDYWGLYHILLFFIMTIIFPKQYMFLFLLGIIWEFGEGFLNLYFSYLNIKCYKKWWYFQYIDILYNSIGIILAKILLNIIK